MPGKRLAAGFLAILTAASLAADVDWDPEIYPDNEILKPILGKGFDSYLELIDMIKELMYKLIILWHLGCD